MGAAPEKSFISGGLQIGGAFLQSEATEDVTEKTIAGLEKEKQELAQAEKERSLRRMENLNNIIGTNLTIAASRGIAPASGSFKAVTDADFHKFNEDEQMDELNTQMKQQRLEVEEEEARAKAEAQKTSGFLGAVGTIITDLL